MSKLYLLPISVYLIFQITFLGTYIAAVLQHHVVPTVPYISDAATYSPESNFFSQLINIGCVLLGLVIYIRYRQIVEIYVKHDDARKLTEKINWIAVWIGFGSSLGISIVGNFQETNVRIAHYIGAFSCFGLGTVYFWIQAIISYYLQPYVNGCSMLKAHLRLGLAVLCTVIFFIIAVTGVISHILYQGQDPRKWYPSDGGWNYHVASSISEWIMATAFCFYILSFTDEFRYIHLDHPQITLIEYEQFDDHYTVVIEDTMPIVSNIEEIS